MKVTLRNVVALAGLLGACAAAFADEPAPTPPAATHPPVIAPGAPARATSTPEHFDPSTTDRQVRQAIESLASSDPKIRDAAAQRLIALGSEARRAVFDASRSDSPELRAKAAEILYKLPWYLPDDAPQVRQLLADYGQLNTDRRREVVAALAENKLHGFDALLRLIVEEPSDDVKWAIVSAVRFCYREEILARFRALDTADDSSSAPLLAAAGHAWFIKDQAVAAKLLRRAVDVENDHPSNDQGELSNAFDRLQFMNLLADKHDAMAGLARLRAGRTTPEEGDVPYGVLELFSLHARFGPLAGFEKDLTTYTNYLEDPRLLYCLAKVYERGGQPALAQSMIQGAFLSGIVSAESRRKVGEFLFRQGWSDLAEAEWASILDLDSPTGDYDHANAHFRLAQSAMAREDDAAIADHLQRAMEIHSRAHGQLQGTTEKAIWQDIYWHRLRAARQKNDNAQVLAQLTEILRDEAPLENPDIANDLVPLLHSMGRVAESKALFDKTYTALRAKMDEQPDEPMPRNNLAWLCIRCGQHKTEALELARTASTLIPDNAAFKDTLAEALFETGKASEAAAIERMVVKVRPNDLFLKRQLERFEGAAKAKNPQ